MLIKAKDMKGYRLSALDGEPGLLGPGTRGFETEPKGVLECQCR